MPIKTDNVVLTKSKVFAVRIIKLYQFLSRKDNPNREFVISQQILRSGTSIGANVRESRRAQSKKDFIAKLYVSLKEADETEYWLELLYETQYISEEIFNNMRNDCEEIIKILTTIIKTVQKREGNK
ncbi:MAG: four helix bundle protein [Paludibacteraceae bacterium]|nr:four helix bundle protein [Paludibacteraceae bacterium]